MTACARLRNTHPVSPCDDPRRQGGRPSTGNPECHQPQPRQPAPKVAPPRGAQAPQPRQPQHERRAPPAPRRGRPKNGEGYWLERDSKRPRHARARIPRTVRQRPAPCRRPPSGPWHDRAPATHQPRRGPRHPVGASVPDAPQPPAPSPGVCPSPATPPRKAPKGSPAANPGAQGKPGTPTPHLKRRPEAAADGPAQRAAAARQAGFQGQLLKPMHV